MVLDYLQEHSGIYFDPQLVSILLDEVKESETTIESKDNPKQQEEKATAYPLILGADVCFDLGQLLYRVQQSRGEIVVRLVAQQLLARLAPRYEVLPALWNAIQGQSVDRHAFDIEWNSLQNQACWITSLEPVEVIVLARVLHRLGTTVAMQKLAEKLEKGNGAGRE